MQHRGPVRFLLAVALLVCGCALLFILVRHQIELAAPSHRPSLADLMRAFQDPETALQTLGAVVVLVFSGVLFAPHRPVVGMPIASADGDTARRLSDEPPQITVTPLETGLDEFPRSERPTSPGVKQPSDFEKNPFEAITARPGPPPDETPSVSVPNNPVPRIDEPERE